MTRRLFCLALGLASAALSAGPAAGQGKVDHPRLRAALHEMREARAMLQESRVNYPQGLKERALAHLDGAMQEVQAILAVKDVNTFVGYDRKDDYYNRFADNPRLRSALSDVRDARDELRAAKADFGGHKDAALDNLDIVAGDIVVLIRTTNSLKKK
jgi:hypothetical protein